MEQLSLLIFLSISMLIGSFLSGSIPMAIKMSESKSSLLALTGSGILCGTALAIIIPEGIDSLYGKETQASKTISSPKPYSNHVDNDDHISISNDYDNSQESTRPRSKTAVIGVSLVVGFVLMLLIDQFSIYQGSSDHDSHTLNSTKVQYNLTRQEDDLDTILEEDEEIDTSEDVTGQRESNLKVMVDNERVRISTDSDVISPSETHRISINESGSTRSHYHSGKDYHYSPRAVSHRINSSFHYKLSGQSSNGRNNKVTPTLGLVIHAAADGIALGAAASASHRDVELIIFLAIMLHKAPAAFSLVALLMHKGLKHTTIRRHLLAFSLSAPLAALVTYFGLSQSGKEALRRNDATGIALLFSAGTFLFVATVHVLPELTHNKLLRPRELLFLVGGTFLPILLAQTV